MSNESADIAIVGGGAAGLTAAIFAAQTAPNRRILVLDGAAVLGAKILVAGGGRCNVTHHVVKPDDYNANRNIVRNVLAAFDVPATVAWFQSMGVELKREDTGKLFPVTDSARTVLNALLNRCRQLGVEIRPRTKVSSITKADGFVINSTLRARAVILTPGGRSLPKTGSDGSGWTLASALGHTVTPIYPALVPLVLDGRFFHKDLSGIAHEVELTTLVSPSPGTPGEGGVRVLSDHPANEDSSIGEDSCPSAAAIARPSKQNPHPTLSRTTGRGTLIDRRSGSLLWTHFGISGPVAMDASRHWVIAAESGRSPTMRANLLPGQSPEAAEKWLIGQFNQRPKAGVGGLLSPRLPERVAVALVHHAGVDPAAPAGQITRDQRRRLVTLLTALPLPVVGPRGWNYAEVTAGGVPLDEIDYRTMQSRKTPGVYLAGEILDCDGRIGGFNFQWAWATGFLAGRSAVME